jgi:membrane-bound lytic murein transglycosylase
MGRRFVALDGQKLEICWLKDLFDLLATQIEGSGRVIPRRRHAAARQLRLA